MLHPESFDVEDIYDLDPEESDIITGVHRFGQQLVVGKRKGLYLGQGKAPAFMNILRTRVTHGPISHWGMVSYLGSLYYPSEHGIYVFDGIQEHYISEPVESIYKTFELDSASPPSGIFYPGLNMLMWSFTTAGGSGTPDTLVCYNVTNKEWTTRPLEAARVSSFLDPVGRTRFWVGHQDGRVWEGDVGENDDSEPITAEVIFRAGDLHEKNLPEVNNFRHIYVLYDTVPGSSAVVTVSYALDDPDANYTLAGTFVPNRNNQVAFTIDGRGHRLFVKISVTSTEPLVIRGVQYDGKPLGRYDK